MPSFEVQATYRAVADDSREYRFFTSGTVSSGKDAAETYSGKMIVYADTIHPISVRADATGIWVENMPSSDDHTIEAGREQLNLVFMTTYLSAIFPALPPSLIQAEAAEALTILQHAGMGPKIGLPETQHLQLVAQSSAYK